VIFECWSSEDGTELSFLPDDHPQHDFLTKDVDDVRMVHLYSIRAETYVEAKIAHHECQGWEPYVPME
jgi:hypothetical protein